MDHACFGPRGSSADGLSRFVEDEGSPLDSKAPNSSQRRREVWHAPTPSGPVPSAHSEVHLFAQ